MLAQRITMVRPKHDDSIFGQTKAVQCTQQSAHIGIDKTH